MGLGKTAPRAALIAKVSAFSYQTKEAEPLDLCGVLLLLSFCV